MYLLCKRLWSSLLNGELKLKIVKVVGPIKFEVL